MKPRETLRRQYLPATPIRLLFAGESPPASGRFFYQRDSGLYRAFRDAFQDTDSTFLDNFRDLGCYLVDLCPHPVDDLEPGPRRAACRDGEASLGRDIAELRPHRIATLLRSIEGNVGNAIAQAGWAGPVLHLPYPGRWARHRRLFTELLQPVIQDLRLR